MVDIEDKKKTGTIQPGPWHTGNVELPSVAQVGSNNYGTQAAASRERYTDYFSGEGNVPWQMRMIGMDYKRCVLQTCEANCGRITNTLGLSTYNINCVELNVFIKKTKSHFETL
ncbi:hypothetical protein PR048_001799 [Dryococelus australis]|uniref:Uncharacterized protein n=1 Tax=Dryococelus australis TaxID=614101 RepID=A0ABQ9IJT9_9NEOP|nr:hypothetical protein PR048_001799 [Dryococelus australis]